MQHTRRLVVVVFALVLEIHLIFYLCYFVSKRGGFHSIAYWHAKSFSGVVGIVAMPLGRQIDAMRCVAFHQQSVGDPQFDNHWSFLTCVCFRQRTAAPAAFSFFPSRETSISKQSIHEFAMVAAFSKY
jgi:hypothetical protein